ncbi:MAG: hypothetical protein K2X38_25525 [Gemmataceae bacterium]|nr:hypothetical protein [Gemmataceae bacterium]
MKRAWLASGLLLAVANTASAQLPKLGNFSTTGTGKLQMIPVDTTRATRPPTPLQSSYPTPSIALPRNNIANYVPTKLSLGKWAPSLPSFFRSSSPVTNVPLRTTPLPKQATPPPTKQ